MARRDPRVDAQVRQAIGDVLETEIADPRLTFVTITEVDVTPDHRYATVYYTTLDPDIVSRDARRTGGDVIVEAEQVDIGLEAAVGRIQTLVGKRVGLRHTPQLRFERDPVVEQADRVERLLRDLDDSDLGRSGDHPGPRRSRDDDSQGPAAEGR